MLFIHVVLVLVTLIGGRIISSFTANWLRRPENAGLTSRLPTLHPPLEAVVFTATVATGICVVLLPGTWLTGSFAVIAAIAHGYAWFPVGYLMSALSIFTSQVDASSALHALTVGAIATMILAVTTRVPLGHTGRALRASGLANAAYITFSLAALVRVFGVSLGMDHSLMLNLSAIGWSATFLLFLIAYWRILTGPRVDAS
jgi:uncharacterized protein involved in response to NO